MTEPRWDLIHDAVITDDEPPGCRCGYPDDDPEFPCADAEERQQWLDEQDALGSDCA